MSSKNKTHVPPGLWEHGPPAYCFGIWGRTEQGGSGLEREKDTAERLETEGERWEVVGGGHFCQVNLDFKKKRN